MAENWTEDDSETYRGLSRYAVPEREQQLAAAVALVAASPAEGPVLDLCCGEGLLTAALLATLPGQRVLAYDGSPSMLATTAGRAAAPDRLTTRRIALEQRDWRRFEAPLRAVVSSLAIHHLDGTGKRQLFQDLQAALAPGGVFVLADVIRPARPVGEAIAAELWDAAVRQRAQALDGTLAGFEAFEAARWNHFRHGGADEIDKPSTLLEQLDWLRTAGFTDLDLHWMTGGQMLLSAWKG